jgi:hypothetical protein
MNSIEARKVGEELGRLLCEGDITHAVQVLDPILATKTPFHMLDRIASTIWHETGHAYLDSLDTFSNLLRDGRSMGGWVIIAGILNSLTGEDLAGALHRTKAMIISADVWYATDILGERVPGPSLVEKFEQTLRLLSPWRMDDTPWVRRTVGVAIHFWAKRCRTDPVKAQQLMTFLEPMLVEQQIEAIKGVGWGLKTLGRYYPQHLTAWFERWLTENESRPRSLLIRKAITYLPLPGKQSVLRASHNAG